MSIRGQKMFWAGGIAALSILLAAVSPALAQKYPSRPISVIVPFSAGGSIDILTRTTAGYMSEKFGVPVNVINKPGGNTVPATLEVMSAAADGYTVLGESTNCSLSILAKNLPFKIMDRTFIAIAAGAPMMIVVPGSSPWRTLKDLADHLKKNPEGFPWVSAGSVGMNAYVARQLFAAVGVDVLKTREVMVKGGGEQVAQVAGGHAMMTTLAPASSLSAIRAGSLKALAVAAPQRHPMLPEVPTTAEMGYPTVAAQLWTGFSGPPHLPAEIMEAWNRHLQQMAKDQKVTAQFHKIGALPLYLNSAEAQERVKKEMAEAQKLWGAVK